MTSVVVASTASSNVSQSQPSTATKTATTTETKTVSKDKAATTSVPATPTENRVYVGNLPFATTGDDLKKHFTGASEAKIFSFSSGKSKGCGLVEFKNSTDAQAAIKTLNSTTFNGRTIFVREDREGAPNSGDSTSDSRGRGRGRGRGGRGRGGFRGRGRGGFRGRRGGYGFRSSEEDVNASGPKLFVGNLSFRATEEDVSKAFSEFGKVVSCTIPLNRDNLSKGFALVTMSSEGEAQECIEALNDTELQGRNIVVRADQRQQQQQTTTTVSTA
eukprot:TRINITY_DN378_c0_g1_i1.p1 TRINITY_DN378_c0_g1~~TRINITY_DN378_c0_g1_i1.p1  ORF type:complete len:274 (-),score=79.71 TRINITY_DN378_c0_g1_i1:106-927(-)